LRGLPSLKNVEVRRNGGNIHGNGNIILGFVFARPDEFLWILSDNDIVSPSSVFYILSNLDNKVDFYCFIDEIELRKDIVHDWQSGWQIPMEWRMGLISAALYNMATVRDVVFEGFYFHNSSFPHLAIACAAGRKKGESLFRLLPRAKIIVAEAPIKEAPSDYSFAQVCMPLLLPLFPEWEAKSFSRMWLFKHGIMMHVHKSKYPHFYIQSKATLKYFGGWLADILILFTGLAAILASP
jgi:hypothetical protein